MPKTAPFSKLLVANRGEIAVRIMRTARTMGFRTVAVYSTVDAGAEHVTCADEAVCIGDASPSASYLRVEAIIDAARRTGADAIHPGYGFLAENEALPSACAAAGIVFVGPGAAAIRQMGDKAGAKSLMIAAGVPCVPGYQGEDQSPETLLQQARGIGFPVMIKATAGGGGRGMRLVNEEAEFAAHLASAVSEATSAFGSGTVLLEKAIIAPRHVEIQVMADAHGNAIHLGERDCSLQRRHQKIIEEAPSPAVDAALRERMGEASIAAVEAIGYVGAGTFEYLLDAEGHFYFMEMNTRLQVEHPVTEAITGLDLVELQLRIVAGEKLPLTQEQVTFSGHAIEARLCAEDPTAGFMPQSGRMALWRPAEFLRTDHALSDGANISPHYDSMIAKLVAHGTTREDARRKLIAGLEATVAMGPRTNKDFLAACLAQPVFRDGSATTAFIADHGDVLLAEHAAQEPSAAMVAAALLRAAPGTGLAHGYMAPLRLGRNETEYRPRVRALRDGACTVEMEGQPPLNLRVLARRGPMVEIEREGARLSATLLCETGQVTLQFAGRTYDFTDLTFAPVITAAVAGGDGRIRASMNGNVVGVAVAVGDRIEAGQTLVVVEAMKMEHGHASPVAGTVTAVNVAPGMQVATHAVLVEVEAR